MNSNVSPDEFQRVQLVRSGRLPVTSSNSNTSLAATPIRPESENDSSVHFSSSLSHSSSRIPESTRSRESSSGDAQNAEVISSDRAHGELYLRDGRSPFTPSSSFSSDEISFDSPQTACVPLSVPHGNSLVGKQSSTVLSALEPSSEMVGPSVPCLESRSDSLKIPPDSSHPPLVSETKEHPLSSVASPTIDSLSHDREPHSHPPTGAQVKANRRVTLSSVTKNSRNAGETSKPSAGKPANQKIVRTRHGIARVLCVAGQDIYSPEEDSKTLADLIFSPEDSDKSDSASSEPSEFTEPPNSVSSTSKIYLTFIPPAKLAQRWKVAKKRFSRKGLSCPPVEFNGMRNYVTGTLEFEKWHAKYNFMVDGGSDLCLLSRSMLPPDFDLASLSPFTGKPFVDAHGNFFKPLGVSEFALKISDTIFLVPFVIHDDEIATPILGRPWIGPNKVRPDWDRQLLLANRFGDNRPVEISVDHGHFALRTVGDSIVKAGTICWINCKLPENFDEKVWNISPSLLTSGELRVPQNVSTRDDEDPSLIQVPISNWGSEDVEIKAGAFVAYGEPIRPGVVSRITQVTLETDPPNWLDDYNKFQKTLAIHLIQCRTFTFPEKELVGNRPSSPSATVHAAKAAKPFVWRPPMTPVADRLPPLSDEPVDLASVIASAQSYEEHLKEMKSKEDVTHAKVGSHLTPGQVKEAQKFLRDWEQIFASNPLNPGHYTGPKLRIPTGDAFPIKFLPYRQTPWKETEIARHVKTMLDNGVIEAAKSPWAAPVVLAPKKDGSWRFCVDYRGLNAVTKKDSYPLPRIDDTLDALGNGDAQIYSTMDLASGYWQIPIEDEDKEKTAFTTRSGTYQFTVMPFGLTGAPGAFCRAIDNTLREFLWKCCLVFIDDIIVWSPDFETHKRDLAAIFSQLAQNGFKLKLSKCNFFMNEVEYLGYVIRPGHISVSPKKVEAISNFEPPRTLQGLQRFLGMVGWYRRFIRNFSEIASPLYELLSKDRNAEWQVHIPDTPQNRAFIQLRTSLTQYPILRLPDFTRPFILLTDASTHGIGAVLAQNYDNFEHPVHYFSKSLKRTQVNWHSYELETYALVKALENFKHYLTGVNFTVVTDCRALSYLGTMKEWSPKVERWIGFISQFQISFEHRPGVKLVVPDALSRKEEFMRNLPSQTPKSRAEALWKKFLEREKEFANTPVTVGKLKLPNGERLNISAVHSTSQPAPVETQNEIALAIHSSLILEAQAQDPWCIRTKNLLSSEVSQDEADHVTKLRAKYEDSHGVLYRKPSEKWSNPRLVIPSSLRLRIKRALHDDVLAGHLGNEITYRRIAQRFYWPGLKADVAKYLSKCQTCQLNKSSNQAKKLPLQPLPIHTPWSHVHSDYIGPLPRTRNGKLYILVFTDRCTRWTELVATSDNSSSTTSRKFSKRVLHRHGCPAFFLCDRGSSYQGEFKSLCNQHSIQIELAQPYQHNTNGLVERLNRTIEESLSHYVNSTKNDWDEKLSGVEFALNTSYSRSNNDSAYGMNHGRDPSFPIERKLLAPPSSTPSSSESEEEDLPEITEIIPSANEKSHREVAQERFENGKESRLKYQQRMKKDFDSKHKLEDFKVGDWVKIKTEDRQRKGTKLGRKFDGPYRITGRDERNNLILRYSDQPGTELVSHPEKAVRWSSNLNEETSAASQPQQQPFGADITLNFKEPSDRQLQVLRYVRKFRSSGNSSDEVRPRDLLNRRIEVRWYNSFHKGTVVKYEVKTGKFWVQYDQPPKSNDPEVNYPENLLGKSPPEWSFIDTREIVTWKKFAELPSPSQPLKPSLCAEFDEKIKRATNQSNRRQLRPRKTAK